MHNNPQNPQKVAKTFLEILEKFNPYHDSKGRFSSANGAASFTYAPGKSKAHDLAISREKERYAAMMPSEAQEKTLKSIENKTRNLKKEQFRVVDRDGNVVMQKQGDKDSVSYKVGEARDHFPGNITIHNHPDGGAFSAADLSDFGYGAREIRAAAPEGTYILRDTRAGKWANDQKTWFDMREDLEAASVNFKNDRQLKKEIRASHTEEDAALKKIADTWDKRRTEGAEQEELTGYYNEYKKISDALVAKVEVEVRQAYVDQYHNWYKENSMKYGMEYEFNPVQTRTKKSAYEPICKSMDDGEVVLDKQMNEDIKAITMEILRELIGQPEILKAMSDLDEDEAIDLIVSYWDDAEEFEKANPYHDERGRFTTGPSAGANPMIRTAPPPKNTKIAYKVFVVKDGKLYPPMVANPDAMDTPVGVWLDASEGKRALNPDGSVKTNTMGRERVKAGGPGTQGGSGDLAYRPGWHLGDLPVADQFYTKDKKTGEKLQKKNFVWAECEIAADVDYQQEAMSYGYNKNGKFQHSLAGLPKMPTDGYYTYRTNPDPNTRPWYITGSMKVNRILTDAETNQILRDNGIEPRRRAGGELDLEKLGITQTDFTKNAFSIYKADEDKRLIFGWASVAVRTDGEQVVDLQKDMIDPEDLEDAVYDYVLEFRDSGEEHIADLRKKGRMVESVIFTKEKMKAMGIPEGVVPEGWWIGFYIDDDDAWEKVKDGTYQMFSIEGQGVREAVEKASPNYDEFPEYHMWLEENLDATIEEQKAAKEWYAKHKPKVAKSFKEIIEKFNPWHDERGRFTSRGGRGAAFNRDYGETGTKDAVEEWSKQSNSLSGFVDKNGKLTPEREKLHRQIIDDILRDKTPEAGQATMTMMGGGPASGKSSVIDNGFVKLTDENKTVTIDPDFLKSKLPGYEEMALKTDKAAGFYHEESSALAKRLYAVALSENINVVYDGTGDGSLNSAMGKIKQAKAAGYQVKGEYVTIDTAEALRRNQKRYEDGLRKYESGESQTPPRLPNEKLVVSTHQKVTDIAVACAAEFDTLNIYDNNGAKGSTKLIATGGSGKGLTAIDKPAFNKFLAKGSGNFKTLPDGQVVPE